MVGVSTDVSGIVSDDRGQGQPEGRSGDVLFKLDDQPFRLALERAEAQLGIVRNDLDALKASYQQCRRRSSRPRPTSLYYETSSSASRSSRPTTSPRRPPSTRRGSDLRRRQQKVASLKPAAGRHRRPTCGDPDQPVEEHPRYKQALAARDEAARQLAHTHRQGADSPASSPMSPSLQVGQYLAGVQPAFSLVSTDHVWIAAEPEGDRADLCGPGQTVTSRSTPIRASTGTARSRASARPPAPASRCCRRRTPAATGSRSCSASRCACASTTCAGKPPLRVGMSVEVDVETGHARGLPDFITDLFGSDREP